MGARFLAIGLIGSVLWYGWHWRFSTLSVLRVSLRIVLFSFLAAVAGKIVGIIAFNLGSTRSRT